MSEMSQKIALKMDVKLLLLHSISVRIFDDYCIFMIIIMYKTSENELQSI